MRLRGRGLRAGCRARRGRRRTAARPQRRQGAARARHRARAAAAGVPADQHGIAGRRRCAAALPRAARGGLDRPVRRTLSHRPSRRPAPAAAGATAGERHSRRQAVHRGRLARQRRGGTALRRGGDRGRHRGWRRRHQFDGAGEPVRGAAGTLHRTDGVAMHGADRLRPDQGRTRRVGHDRPRRVRRLDRPRRPRDLLSDPRRRALQHLRRPRFRSMGRGIVVDAEQRRRAPRRLSRLERGVARDAGARRAVLQVGHSRPRSAAPMDARPRHAARRRGPPDDADAGARGRHHSRGRL